MDEIRRGLLEAEEGERLCLVDKYWLCTLREKSIYENLGKMESTGKLISGYFWANHVDKNKVKEILDDMVTNDPNFAGVELKKVQSDELPPSKFHTNYLLAPAQKIVDTYGIPRYQELNPAVFTIATFPYLFGVMFGDMGHGGMLLAFATWLCLSKRKSRPPGTLSFDAWPFRYLLVLMGFFAVYCGIIYNEFFGISTNWFGSCYRLVEKEERFIREDPECVVSVGIDPVWSKSENEIAYLNSFKMKLSVIIGVTQMTLGLVLKALNNIHFKDWPSLLFETLPQIGFLLCTFGYMIFCIIFKWFIDWTNRNPPSIVNIMIGFVSKADPPLWGDGDSQLWTQRALASLVCIPLMLFPKPFLVWKGHKGYTKVPKEPKKELDNDEDVFFSKISIDSRSDIYHEEAEEVSRIKRRVSPERHEEHKEEFGDVAVHQFIETIEFVLGSVSNTASYLRLWALSLAHRQLSIVFFEMLLMPYINKRLSVFSGVVGLSFSFIFFMVITFGVLMLMDLLECFLHALRLHWVEFQNKFYKGDGYFFESLDHSKPLKEFIHSVPN